MAEEKKDQGDTGGDAPDEAGVQPGIQYDDLPEAIKKWFKESTWENLTPEAKSHFHASKVMALARYDALPEVTKALFNQKRWEQLPPEVQIHFLHSEAVAKEKEAEEKEAKEKEAKEKEDAKVSYDALPKLLTTFFEQSTWDAISPEDQAHMLQTLQSEHVRGPRVLFVAMFFFVLR